jgi:phospholipase/lecithinase/hemolysin
MKKPLLTDTAFDLNQVPGTYRVEGAVTPQSIDRLFSDRVKFKLDFGDFKPKPTQPYSQLVVFGDSFSDTGNLFAFSGGTFPTSPYFQGRFSDGPIWVDFLAPNLELSGSAVQSFAFGGATTGRDNIINAFLPAPILPGLHQQIDTFRQISPQADPNALYVVWAGANDLRLMTENPQTISTAIPQAIANLSIAITQLAQAGAKQIVVPNQFDFGLSPFARNLNRSAIATQATLDFNKSLDKALNDLERSLRVDLIEVDVFKLGEKIAAKPEKYGFTNIRDQLIQQPNPVNPSGYFWWDDIHITSQVQRLVSQEIQSALPSGRRSNIESVTLNDRSQPTLAASLVSPLQQV